MTSGKQTHQSYPAWEGPALRRRARQGRPVPCPRLRSRPVRCPAPNQDAAGTPLATPAFPQREETWRPRGGESGGKEGTARACAPQGRRAGGRGELPSRWGGGVGLAAMNGRPFALAERGRATTHRPSGPRARRPLRAPGMPGAPLS